MSAPSSSGSSEAPPILTTAGRKGPLSGAQWDDYLIGDLLGEGGMATVYLAWHRHARRLIALKVLPARLAYDEDFRKRFELEARAAGLLDTPHVVKVYHAGRFGDLYYFEMEYVEGQSLDLLCSACREQQRQLPVGEAVDYCIQAARGLAEAGSKGLVHRDIKPGNLMLTSDGTVKITDFGIVKVMGEEALTMTGVALGTPTYMSPEQGRGSAIDQRADIYSLGVVFYELLTMRTPFAASTADALIYQHHFAEPEPIAGINPDVGAALAAVVCKCMQKRPDRRYQDAAELLRDLELVRSGQEPALALFPGGRLTTGAKEALAEQGGQRRRLWPALAVLGALLMALSLSWWWWDAKRGQIRELRGRLQVLGQPHAIPATAAGDLQRLTRLVGERDADVARWHEKLAAVSALDQDLAGLEARVDQDRAAYAQALKDLRAYALAVGDDHPTVAHWRARLAGLDNEAAQLRVRLAGLDGVALATLGEQATAEPLLARLARLTTADDADVARWRSKLAASAAAIAELRQQLAPLAAATALPQAACDQAAPALEQLRRLAGDDDGQVLAGARALAASRARLAGLRATLAVLDQQALVPLAVQQGVADDLAAFRALAAADDADRKRWDERLAATARRLDELKLALPAIDKLAAVPADRQVAFQDDLDAYRLIAGADDQDGQRWMQRLTASRERVAALRAVLVRLDQDQSLTTSEQALMRSVVEELRALHALDPAQEERYAGLLARASARLVVLREALTVLDRAASLPDGLGAKLDEYVPLAGTEDEAAKRWRAKYERILELRQQLAVLDKPRPLPKGIDAQIEAYLALVGRGDPDAAKWASKVQRVHDLKEALAPLDQVRALPPDAAQMLARLDADVGEDEADARRWRQKVTRVEQLLARFAGIDRIMILPEWAPGAYADLAAAIGSTDAQVARIGARLAVLNGPRRPAWADAYGRDAQGVYADATCAGVSLRFRLVPAGGFVMGSPRDEAGRGGDEPQVQVFLTRSFWLADTECTQALWQAVMGGNPSYTKAPDRPVDSVSWVEARSFVEALRALGHPALTGARLPTEAEWEYACRAGGTGPFSRPGVSVAEPIDRWATYAANAAGGTSAVKAHAPNPLGLYDLHGNVWEWCQDTYRSYDATPLTDPVALGGGPAVVRGGSWGDHPGALRAASRRALARELRSAYVGFRVALDAENPVPPTRP